VPIYEYVCSDCGKKTEVIQRVGERPIRLCPHCGGKVKKAFSAPAIQFKGTGFYITDYASAKKEGKKEGRAEKTEAGEKKAETGEARKTEGGDSKKKESKEKKPAKD
jgi:putative FmdB family regulatory protein